MPGQMESGRPSLARNAVLRKTRVRRVWLAAGVVLLLLVGGLAGVMIVSDRESSLRASRERIQPMARLIAAHAEGALEDADELTRKLTPLVEQWDFTDETQGQRIFAAMRESLPGTPQISSAWVTDGAGISRVDTWVYPSQPIGAAERPYYKAHQQHAVDPVILGDVRPGVITGQQRFTLSRALRNADGSLRGLSSWEFTAAFSRTSMQRPRHGRELRLASMPSAVPYSVGFKTSRDHPRPRSPPKLRRQCGTPQAGQSLH